MKINRIIFADKRGNNRSAMARALFEKMYPSADREVLARGLVVSFEGPLNQKAEAVMVSNGLETEGFRSKQLTDDVIMSGTLIFTMNAVQREQVIEGYKAANENNTFVLSTFAGEELEIMDPYGGNLQVYGICLEALKSTLEKIQAKIHQMEEGGDL